MGLNHLIDKLYRNVRCKLLNQSEFGLDSRDRLIVNEMTDILTAVRSTLCLLPLVVLGFNAGNQLVACTVILGSGKTVAHGTKHLAVN